MKASSPFEIFLSRFGGATFAADDGRGGDREKPTSAQGGQKTGGDGPEPDEKDQEAGRGLLEAFNALGRKDQEEILSALSRMLGGRRQGDSDQRPGVTDEPSDEES
ncbi:hypothetical protein [Roseibium sp.]|uniref:hypothetical protein n=1 Tax=Roseibium sp. TaxID=1936156 RepID=UPI003A976477